MKGLFKNKMLIQVGSDFFLMGIYLIVLQAFVKTGSSRSGTDERGKCDNIGLSAACPSNEATICSVVVVVA